MNHWPILLLSPALLAQAPAIWQAQSSGCSVELRGLSAPSAKVAWASGAKGTVLRTVDGATWTTLPVPGAEGLDFRDVEALDAQRAWVLAAGMGTAGRIYRTQDGGQTWTLQFTNPEATGFLDALSFWDDRHGIALGDAVRGRFQILLTADGGGTWTNAPEAGMPLALDNEGAFAASGTCLCIQGTQEAWFATGGAKLSRVFHSSDRGGTWTVSNTPVPVGGPSEGLFSVAFLGPQVGLAVGGDYRQKHNVGPHGALSRDGGRTWTATEPLPGFLSGLSTVPGARQTLVAVGLAGTALSADEGRTWTTLDTTPLNAVAFADPATGWAVGPMGLILKYATAPGPRRTLMSSLAQWQRSDKRFQPPSATGG